MFNMACAADSADQPSPKKIKLDTKEALSSFHNFHIESILNDKPKEKVIFLHGRFKESDEDAVVILEKSAFNKDDLSHLLSEKTSLKVSLKNDIYSTYEGYTDPAYNAINTTVIYPATKKHIEKYSFHELYLIEETPEDYKMITLPYIESKSFSIQWVYNILDKKTEAERIVFEDDDPKNGFILLPDMKWDRKQMDSLYLIAIVHRHGIRSIRDLTTEHLPLLKNILQKSKTTVAEKFGVGSSKLRIYLHYQPSYFHLHVHVTHIKYDAPGCGIERAHLLSDVIDNIEAWSDYYQTKTLSYVVRDSDELYKQFKEAGKV